VRKVSYKPGTIIPNPARRRVGRELNRAAQAEGQARRKLESISKRDAPEKWAEAAIQLKKAVARHNELAAAYRSVPARVTIEEAGLADELVYHTTEYKTALDAVRIACMNAEADLARELARFLFRPTEAKRVLKNLFCATGDLKVCDSKITLTLDPAGTRNELQALASLFKRLNRQKLTHPGDPAHRPLIFRLRRAQKA
jgi:hypothetical protein